MPLVLAPLAKIHQRATDIVVKRRAMRLAHRTLDGMFGWLVRGGLSHPDTRPASSRHSESRRHSLADFALELLLARHEPDELVQFLRRHFEDIVERDQPFQAAVPADDRQPADAA